MYIEDTNNTDWKLRKNYQKHAGKRERPLYSRKLKHISFNMHAKIWLKANVHRVKVICVKFSAKTLLPKIDCLCFIAAIGYSLKGVYFFDAQASLAPTHVADPKYFPILVLIVLFCEFFSLCCGLNRWSSFPPQINLNHLVSRQNRISRCRKQAFK